MNRSRWLELCELAERHCRSVRMDLPALTDTDAAGVLAWSRRLFPERLPDGQHRTDKATRISAGDILLAVAGEVEVACCAASDMAAGVVLNAVDHDRLRLAARRLSSANEVCNGRR